jgi:phosphatidylinositol glycan class B
MFGRNPYPDRFHATVFVVAVLAHLITAWNSTGYHSADEHHQIIEFAQYQLDELPRGHLAWEFPTRIRSSIQPWTAVVVIKGARALGLNDPAHLMFLLRLLSAALALWAVHRFVHTVKEQVPASLQRTFVVLSYFLWFLPFLHVRFSSEGWSASFLVLGLSELLRLDRSKSAPYLMGLWGTLAMLVRPSSAVVIAGALGWLLFVHRPDPGQWLRMAATALLVAIAGAALDTLFYATPTFSTWNYWMMAITGPPREAFDTLPWYYYPPWIMKYAIPPVGLMLLAAYAVVLIRRPRHLLVWCITPLLFVLTIIPHKELRFLYPIADLAPWLLVLGYAEWIGWKWSSRNTAILMNTLLLLALVANIMGLLVVTTRPAGNGRTAFLPAMKERGNVTYLIDPSIAWRVEVPPFYRTKREGDTVIAPSQIQGPFRTALVIAQETDLEAVTARTGQTFIPLTRTAPVWEETLLRWYTWNEGWPPWTLYAVQEE